MNKKVFSIGLTLCSAILLANGTPSFAAQEVDQLGTEGSIGFGKSSDIVGEVIKPETMPNQIIIPDTGNQSRGDLRIQHVPDFEFGIQEISSGVQLYHPSLEGYTFKDQTDGVGQYYLPHFIQVSDYRGNNAGWSLSVHATPFKRSLSGDELPFTTISLKEARLSNNIHDNQTISERIDTFRGAGNQGSNILEIPLDEAQATTVMTTKSNTVTHTTSGTHTSLVLNETYDQAKLDYAASDLNPGVELKKSNYDVPLITEDDPYVSTITWTLKDGI